MPDHAWSKTYTEADEWQTPNAYRPFLRAINERIRSVDPTFATFAQWPEDLAGEDALRTAAESRSWARMQATVNALADLYCDHDVDPEGMDVDEGYRPPLSNRPAWPGTNGWTRKREREITALASGGADGQRARFTYMQGDSFPAELAHSTRLFDRVADAWVLSEDQVSPPDILTSYGLAQPGDLFGPWILNELRDAINDLWMTELNPYVYQQTVSSADAPTHPHNASIGMHVHTQYSEYDADPAIYAANLAAALAAGVDAVCDNAEDDLPTTDPGWMVDGLSGTSFLLFVSGNNSEPRTFTLWARIDNTKSKPAVVDVPHHCLCTIDWYMGSRKPYPLNGSYTPSWDANGTGFTENLLKKIGETSSATAVMGEIEGPVVGDLAVLPARPPAMTNTGYNDEGKVHGYGDFGVRARAYARWNVSGGFAYTSASP